MDDRCGVDCPGMQVEEAQKLALSITMSKAGRHTRCLSQAVVKISFTQGDLQEDFFYYERRIKTAFKEAQNKIDRRYNKRSDVRK